jgi:hypothetical protein
LSDYQGALGRDRSALTLAAGPTSASSPSIVRTMAECTRRLRATAKNGEVAKRARAYHLIAAAEVMSELSTTVDIPPPTNERQSRELLRIPEPAQRKEVREELVRDHGPPVRGYSLPHKCFARHALCIPVCPTQGCPSTVVVALVRATAVLLCWLTPRTPPRWWRGLPRERVLLRTRAVGNA